MARSWQTTQISPAYCLISCNRRKFVAQNILDLKKQSLFVGLEIIFPINNLHLLCVLQIIQIEIVAQQMRFLSGIDLFGQIS
jgi:hypothetical protein